MSWRQQGRLCLLAGIVLPTLLYLLPTLVPALTVLVLTLLGLPLGAIALLLGHRLCGAAWGEVAEARWQSLLATLPPLAVALLSLLLSVDALYPAFRGEFGEPSSPFKEAYLHRGFFIARSLFYVAVWLLLAGLLTSSRRWRESVYGLALVLWLWSLSFFAIDWYLSMKPTFYSDIFGFLLASYYLAGAALYGLLFQTDRERGTADLARLCVALLISWAFLSTFQWILIWSANLPAEIGWYLSRREGYWPLAVPLWLLLFFGLPLALLSGPPRGGRTGRHWAASLGLVGYLLQGLWLLLPSYHLKQGESIAAVLVVVIAMVMLVVCLLWQRPSTWRQGGES